MAISGKPFLLRPDTPPEGKVRTPKSEDEEDGSLSEPLATIARDAGLVMRRPGLTSYTLYALEASEYAAEQGRFMDFHRAAYRAYWERGEDLGDLDVLRGLADECELDSHELTERLESKHYRDGVMGDYQEAVQMGVQGIPSFVIGKLFFSGAQPYPVFRSVMEQALGNTREV